MVAFVFCIGAECKCPDLPVWEFDRKERCESTSVRKERFSRAPCQFLGGSLCEHKYPQAAFPIVLLLLVASVDFSIYIN